MKNILISGGSGFVGLRLVGFLREKGYRIKTLSRNSGGEDVIQWNPREGKLPQSALDDCDAVINLAGANIGSKRWTDKRKQVLWNSRIESTRTLVNGMGKSKSRPRVFISMSGVNYYAPGNSVRTEKDPPGNTFLAKLCTDWEAEAMNARDLGIRTAILRLGVVLDPSGGALKKMLLPFRLGLGGPIGSGAQGFPWINMQDLLHIIALVLEKEIVDGPLNAVHPQRVDQRTFARTLGAVIQRPTVLPLPAIAFRLLFGQMGEEMLLSNLNVSPDRLTGFQYKYQQASLEECLLDLFSEE